jgi:hypothetical protein
VPDDEVAATLPVVQHVMQDAPFPAVLLSLPLQVDARAANNWDEAHRAKRARLLHLSRLRGRSTRPKGRGGWGKSLRERQHP